MNNDLAGLFLSIMTPNNSYADCLKAMFGLRRFGIKLGLDVIRKILAGLGNPQKKFPSIHIAGTNGKGSIAASLSSILHESGYKVGLYTSPHLVRFNERISINNSPVSDDCIVEAYDAVQNIDAGDRELTFFEFATAMAFYEFNRQNVDWAIIETGMGGRLDATNIIKPVISIISNISLEHRAYLGERLSEIAFEKGGIIKKNSPVIIGAKQKSVVSVLKDIAAEKSAPFYAHGKDFNTRLSKDEQFTYFGMENTWRNMQTSLMGKHQIDNASLVLAACELLNQNGADIQIGSIKEGLLKTKWPGRLEKISDSPVIILDGAHNLIAARRLAEFLVQNIARDKLTLVVGILDDKPYSAMLRSLLPTCSRVILTSPKIDRTLGAEKLYPIAKEVIDDVTIIHDVNMAVAHAIKTVSPDEAVCIAGSLYVIGEAKEAISRL